MARLDSVDVADITGSGGKGGGGGQTFREDENTLQSNATVRVLIAVSEGEVLGLVDGGKSVFLDNTPLVNSDGSKNFGGRIAWDQRVGLPSQPKMSGFTSVANEFTVNTEITAASPVSRTTSGTDIDAMRVAIGLPNGLYQQDTSNNAVLGTSVQFQIEKKLSASGAWLVDRTVTIGPDKCTSPYEVSYRVERPGTTGAWDVRVIRLTADNASSTLRNNTAWNRYSEIKDVSLEYENTAYVGVGIDAKSIGSSRIPVVSFRMRGVKVKVPTNYDSVTRAYTGIWDGTFKFEYTNNPAWVLYDLIAHPRYGMGEVVSEDQIDKYAFYDAAVYNDGVVPFTDEDGVTSDTWRFTFNYPIQAREDALGLLQRVASSMRAKVVWKTGFVTLLQDRPASPVALVNKANIVGKFEYKSSALTDRITSVNVTWNDPDDHYLQRVSTVDASSGDLERYGFNPKNVAAYGCTNEGEAIRFGRWYLDTVLNQLEIVTFSQALNGMALSVGEVINLFDEDYAGVQNAGRIVSGTTTSLTLDRPLVLTSGSSISVLLADGTTFETRGIVETTGTLSTITLATPLSQLPFDQGAYIATTTVGPRQFRINRAALDSEDRNIIRFEAVEHDPGKYARVEAGVTATPPVFSVVPPLTVAAPTSLSVAETATYIDNVASRSLLLAWQVPTQGVVVGYRVQYRRQGEAWSQSQTQSNFYELQNVLAGVYEFRVVALSYADVISPALTGSYTVNTIQSSGSPLSAVTSLIVVGGGTTFAGVDLNVQWTNPTANGTTAVALRDFEVKVIDPVSSLTLRTEYISPVVPGGVQTYSYTYTKNTADGGPRRSVRLEVRARDVNNKTAAATTVTFSNPTPAAFFPVASSGYLSNIIRLTRPSDSDFAGFIVWGSTTNGFAIGSGTVIYEGNGTHFVHGNLNSATTWYYKAAAYDTFGKSYVGTDLNVSAQASATTLGAVGIARGPTNPASGSEGDLFYNTTDDKLYRYTGTAWTAAVATVDLTGTITAAQIADASLTTAKFASGITPIEIVGSLPSSGNYAGRTVVLTTDGKLYRYHGSAWTSAVPSSDVSGTFTDSQLAAIAAAKITGQITSTQISDNSISTAKLQAGSVTTNEIAANTIVAGDIAAGTITAAQIATGTITATQIASGTITATQIATDTITAGQIAAGAISSSELAAGAVTAGKIAAGTITATEIAAGTITSTQIAADTITAANIAANAITSSELAANAIVAGKIAAATITSGDIAAATITGGNIAANTITAGNIAADTITATQIAANAITSSELAAGSVVAGKIAANAVTATEIAANAVTSGKVAAGSITADKLSVTSLSAITANIGTLRTATTGARTEISDNVIKVYDASGVLRVKLGDLAL